MATNEKHLKIKDLPNLTIIIRCVNLQYETHRNLSHFRYSATEQSQSDLLSLKWNLNTHSTHNGKGKLQ